MDQFKEMIIKMEIVRCKRCERILKSAESIARGYGKVCYRIISLQEKNKITPAQDLENILERIRKLENINRKQSLDINFMKHQLKHKTFVGKSKDADLDWDLKPEVKKVKEETKIHFTVLIKELKIIFHVDNFDYHNILKPINVRETPEDPPIIIGNIELIH